MHKLTFHPLNNADCCVMDIKNGQKILVDYGDRRSDYDLKAKLNEDLEKAQRRDYDVVAITHGDDDHIQGFSDTFNLLHAKKYQGGDRIDIQDLWVPAAILLEKNVTGERAILRAEARYRLKQGERIRVFSNPDKLTDWLKGEGIEPEDVAHLITSAGELVPGYSLDDQGVEFFVHAPFSTSIDGETINRNDAALVIQITFRYGGHDTKLIMGADITHEIWADIVNVTRYYDRDERLSWDVIKVSHHCSYLSLSSEKGENKTKPVPNVEWLFEQGNAKGILLSSSKPIPNNDDDVQPPHRQAANYYKDVANSVDGEFKVTMQHPKKSAPAPLVILIDNLGARIQKKTGSVASVISSKPAPRAG